MKGWICLHRDIRDHWIWQEKPFDRGRAWIDILLRANHADNKTMLGGQLIVVKRGSFITSESQLMDAWGWGKSKTRSFLNLLQNDGMITKISDRRKTTIIVENWDFWQGVDSDSVPLTDRQQTASVPLTDTNNNNKQYNNNNLSYLFSDSEEPVINWKDKVINSCMVSVVLSHEIGSKMRFREQLEQEAEKEKYLFLRMGSNKDFDLYGLNVSHSKEGITLKTDKDERLLTWQEISEEVERVGK